MFPAHCDTLKKKMSKSSSLDVPRVRCWVRVGWVCATGHGVAWLSRAQAVTQVGAATEPCARTHVSPCTAGVPGPARPVPPGQCCGFPFSGGSEPGGAVLQLWDASCVKRTL